MKISIARLTEIVRTVVKEAAAQGAIQRKYKTSTKKAISNATKGGNKNTKPFTKKAAKAGKSGLGPF